MLRAVQAHGAPRPLLQRLHITESYMRRMPSFPKGVTKTQFIWFDENQGTATSTLFLGPFSPSSHMKPRPRRVICPTLCPSLSGADWRLQSDVIPDSRPSGKFNVSHFVDVMLTDNTFDVAGLEVLLARATRARRSVRMTNATRVQFDFTDQLLFGSDPAAMLASVQCSAVFDSAIPIGHHTYLRQLRRYFGPFPNSLPAHTRSPCLSGAV